MPGKMLDFSKRILDYNMGRGRGQNERVFKI